MLAQLHHDPAAAHLMSHCASGTGACKRIKNNIPRLCCQVETALNQRLRLLSFWKFDTAFVVKIIGQDVIPKASERLSGDILAIDQLQDRQSTRLNSSH